ncbi:sensor histidine kinase [Nocardia sp. BMG51109]|uniref:sensor histidine kinase n=1 Tax=Nocardia sp. BMG51109 TaxID=1056816 RepID=UPI0007C4730F|nr:sensor histidine kinase [Nocardia sp. BMG51109]
MGATEATEHGAAEPGATEPGATTHEADAHGADAHEADAHEQPGSVPELPGLPGRIGVRFREFVRDPLGSMHRKIEKTSYDYPASVIYTAHISIIIIAIAAAALRYSYFPTALPFVAVAVLALSYPIYYLLDVEPAPIVLTGSAMITVAIFLAQPVSPDSATLILTVVVGEIAAIAPKKISLAATGAALLEVLGFAALGNVDSGLPMYLVGVVLGWMVGLMLQFQRRSLYQERENQEIRSAQAADEERRRIAREVHDVIAHSLSVTLLHLTAARHTLETDRDVDEAVDALTDAERLGRQAMSDIRRTVGLLDQRSTITTPEPGLDDIAGLVEDFVRAGLPVDYALTGDTAVVSPAMGLALYRIGQESLSNVAKHAPAAEVVLRIEVTDAEVTATVTNTLPGWTVLRSRGMGISGMRQRARLLGGTLTAGPHEGGWQVRARIPTGTGKSVGSGCLTGTDLPLRTIRVAFTSVTNTVARHPIARKPQEGT